jgi:hypothetical protein
MSLKFSVKSIDPSSNIEFTHGENRVTLKVAGIAEFEITVGAVANPFALSPFAAANKVPTHTPNTLNAPLFPRGNPTPAWTFGSAASVKQSLPNNNINPGECNILSDTLDYSREDI